MYFVLAMVRYPEVALKIQAELDSVLGLAERLPRAEDRERMPYVQNAMAELLRWQPVSPLGKLSVCSPLILPRLMRTYSIASCDY